ncbi:MAG: hypothetical protein ACI9GO_000399 [Bacteroidia bacterium]|jgi:hypothetical protein
MRESMKMTILIVTALLLILHFTSSAQGVFYAGLATEIYSDAKSQTYDLQLIDENNPFNNVSHRMNFALNYARPISLKSGYKKNSFGIEAILTLRGKSIVTDNQTDISYGFFPPFGDPDTTYLETTFKTRTNSIDILGMYYFKDADKLSPYIQLGISLSQTDLIYFQESDKKTETEYTSIQLYDKFSLGHRLQLGIDYEISGNLSAYASAGYIHTIYTPTKADALVNQYRKSVDEIYIRHNKQNLVLDSSNSSLSIENTVLNATIGITYIIFKQKEP